MTIPEGWRAALRDETEKPYFRELTAFLEAERKAGHRVLPEEENIFQALECTPLDRVRVLLLGQDPYPTPGHAHGLCFSVRPDVRPIPGSLRNIYKELRADLGLPTPEYGCLESWARQGILMLNTVLTVRAGEANSHQKRGWETFTTRIVERVNARAEPVVFVLWGRQAQAKRPLITGPHHRVVESAHPSPLSARLFLGCRCFSAIDRNLVEAGGTPIDWRIPAVPLLSASE